MPHPLLYRKIEIKIIIPIAIRNPVISQAILDFKITDILGNFNYYLLDYNGMFLAQEVL